MVDVEHDVSNVCFLYRLYPLLVKKWHALWLYGVEYANSYQPLLFYRCPLLFFLSLCSTIPLRLSQRHLCHDPFRDDCGICGIWLRRMASHTQRFIGLNRIRKSFYPRKFPLFDILQCSPPSCRHMGVAIKKMELLYSCYRVPSTHHSNC